MRIKWPLVWRKTLDAALLESFNRLSAWNEAQKVTRQALDDLRRAQEHLKRSEDAMAVLRGDGLEPERPGMPKLEEFNITRWREVREEEIDGLIRVDLEVTLTTTPANIEAICDSRRVNFRGNAWVGRDCSIDTQQLYVDRIDARRRRPDVIQGYRTVTINLTAIGAKS